MGRDIPLPRRAVGPGQPDARHRNSGRAEGAEDLAVVMTMPMPRHSVEVQDRLQFTLQHRLDERADVLAHPASSGLNQFSPNNGTGASLAVIFSRA